MPAFPTLRRCLGPGLLGLALFVVACGGENEAYEGASEEGARAFQALAGTWLDRLADEDLADLDRDYVFCLGPDDPVPVVTPPPDPSGHTRAQLPCMEAAAKVEPWIEPYRALVQELEGLPVPEEPALQDAHAQIVEIYSQRLRLFEEIAAARAAGDVAELARLRERLVEVVEIELTGRELVASVGGPGS